MRFKILRRIFTLEIIAMFLKIVEKINIADSWILFNIMGS